MKRRRLPSSSERSSRAAIPAGVAVSAVEALMLLGMFVPCTPASVHDPKLGIIGTAIFDHSEASVRFVLGTTHECHCPSTYS